METLYKILKAKKNENNQDIPLEIYPTQSGKKLICEALFGKTDIKKLNIKDKIHSLYEEYIEKKGLKKRKEITAELIENILLNKEALNKLEEKFEELKLSDKEKKLYQSLFNDIVDYIKIKKEIELLQDTREESVNPLVCEGIISDNNKWVLIQLKDNLILLDRNLIALIKAPIKKDDPVYKKEYNEFFG